jgi:hypothetical protein
VLVSICVNSELIFKALQQVGSSDMSIRK